MRTTGGAKKTNPDKGAALGSRCPEAPDGFRALKQPGSETGSQPPPGCVREGSGLPLKVSGASGWVVL